MMWEGAFEGVCRRPEFVRTRSHKPRIWTDTSAHHLFCSGAHIVEVCTGASGLCSGKWCHGHRGWSPNRASSGDPIVDSAFVPNPSEGPSRESATGVRQAPGVRTSTCFGSKATVSFLVSELISQRRSCGSACNVGIQARHRQTRSTFG